MTEQKYIYSLNDKRFFAPRVNIDLAALPSFLDVGKIGVHYPNLTRLLNLGGISGIRVGFESQNDRSRAVPMTAGISPDGTATAGKGIIKTQDEIYRSWSDHASSPSRHHNSDWIRLSTKLDFDKLQEELKEKNSRQITHWIHAIDDVIRRSIRDQGLSHLLFGYSKEQIINLVYYNFFTFFPFINEYFITNTQTNKLEFTLKVGAFILFLNNYIVPLTTQASNEPGKGYRKSLLIEIEVLRAMILECESRRLPVLVEQKNYV